MVALCMCTCTHINFTGLCMRAVLIHEKTAHPLPSKFPTKQYHVGACVNVCIYATRTEILTSAQTTGLTVTVPLSAP